MRELSKTGHLLLANTACEVRVDALTRQLYATDASHYQILPKAVALPRSAEEASEVVRVAQEKGWNVTPRGAGSGLVGGALGDGLVVDFARYMTAIGPVNVEQRRVRVGAGVVLDTLNAAMRRYGLCFGPDVATSSRATIGGMIANNSSGARTRVYGTTADHVTGVECVLADGTVVDRDLQAAVASQLEDAAQAVTRVAAEVAQRMPTGLFKRWPGYALDRILTAATLPNVLSGSEGTLAAITSAELKLVPLPRESGLALLFFDSVTEAMQATVELLDLHPVAIEHIDDVLTDQTKGQREFARARQLLDLDRRPSKSMLIVEFHENATASLEQVRARKLGTRFLSATTAADMNLVWSLRKAGLALLTGRKGSAKPVTCIEDTAVCPEQLPAYVEGLQGILRPLRIEACFYGHAAAGLLHVRPVIDLHTPEGLKQFRYVTEQVSALVRQFKGSLAAEHGVGMARTEFMREHLGDELLAAMREIKTAFDPAGLLNPGKIFDDGRYRMDTLLRTRTIEVPFEPVVAFAARDESFLANLEQCNGCAGCRKPVATMCPTFLATGEEMMSTRGRANVMRAALSGEFGEPLVCDELAEALQSCLSCKACVVECPSNVNMPLLKAEMKHARNRRVGLTFAQRVISRFDAIGALGSIAPALANQALAAAPIRRTMQRLLGLAPARHFPSFAPERFDQWFNQRQVTNARKRGRVLLWDDCAVRYYEPGIGRAAVRVLEAAGYEVALVRDRKCCGRPAFSQGDLETACEMGRHNLTLLSAEQGRNPFEALIFLEPSCYSMFAEDYREMKLPDASLFSESAVLFENFVESLLARESDALQFERKESRVAIHVHCHARALTDSRVLAQLARRVPGCTATLLDTGCCGMAGAWGAAEENYGLSVQIGQSLMEKIAAQPTGTTVVASGTSCREQVTHLGGTRPLHIAELLAAALD